MHSPETVAMAAGAKPIFGTNPICFGFPRAEPAPPLVFDMSTVSRIVHACGVCVRVCVRVRVCVCVCARVCV